MSIIARFRDIMSSNVNALLDKAENPEKMIDQYLRNLNQDLGKVKAETASIMAAEQRAKRELDECIAEIDKMQRYAVKALEAGNEADAKKFLERKAHLTTNQAELKQAHELAEANTTQMRQMHDKLVADVGELESRRTMLKGKAAVAKTQERMNEMGSTVSGANQSISAFDRMEAKINTSLDEAAAMAELNKGAEDDIADLTAKYADDNETNVDSELEALKAQLQQDKKE